MSTLNAKEYKSFEAIKHTSNDGDEFWYARELAPILEYVQWRNFAKALIADYFNQLDENNKRLVIRGDIKQWNQMLAESAHNAGVISNEEYATFQNAGYMGLYGGLKVEDIHKKKGLKKQDRILDFMSSTVHGCPKFLASTY